MTIDVTQQLNYSQAVRRARPEWDDLQDARMSADANYEEDAREDYYRLCDV